MNWKTALGGALNGFGLAVVAIDPAWTKWGLLIAALGAAFNGIFGRDKNVTSESMGLDQPPIPPSKFTGSKNNPLTYLWLLLLLPVVLLAGCSTSHYTHGDIDISQRRFLWDTTGFEVSQTRDTNGFVTTSLKLQKSNPNAEAIKAVAEGISEGVIKGAGKTINPLP